MRVHVYPSRVLDHAVVGSVPLLEPYGFPSVQNLGAWLQPLFEGMQPFRSSPEQADLFISFVGPHKPPFVIPSRAELQALSGRPLMPHEAYPIARACQAVYNHTASLLHRLRYLTAANRHRHFVIMHLPVSYCSVAASSYETIRPPPEIRDLLVGLDTDSEVSLSEPRQLHLPFLSSVRWSASWRHETPPWLNFTRRPVLLSVTGSVDAGDYAPEIVAIRRAVVAECRTAPLSAACEMLVRDKGDWPSGTHDGEASPESRVLMRAALLLKRRSVFCVEWPGASALGVRKSIVDSILSGCIPIFFAARPAHACDHAIFPAFVALHKLALYVPPQPFIKGTVNLSTALASLSAERVRRLQRAVATQATRLLYPLYHVDGEESSRYIRNSAPEVLLRALLKKNIQPIAHQSSASCEQGTQTP